MKGLPTMIKLEGLFLSQMAGLGVCLMGILSVLPQEDISRLRRKLETTKKPDNVPKCDEILMEEIKDYKVRKAASVIAVWLFSFFLLLLLLSGPNMAH